MPLAGLSIFGDERYRQASNPLFAAGEVDAVEWTLDQWRMGLPPADTAKILKEYGEAGNLIGHGVHYPLLSFKADKLRHDYLKELSRDIKNHKYCGISVHFGFSTGWELAESAPLPVPYCAEAVELGKRAMAELHKVVKMPVGLENLALAFSMKDVEEQGRFVEDLLHDVDGFVLLDLHNIYCQSVNFDVPILDIVKTYPLHRVKEIHISGGSWSEHGDEQRQVRRDTHDGRVPQEILDVLPAVIVLCPRLKFVLMEKLPHSFRNESDMAGFREDFLRMKSVVKKYAAAA